MARLDGERHDDELIRDEVDDEIWILKPNEPRGHAGELEKDSAREADAHRFLFYCSMHDAWTDNKQGRAAKSSARRRKPGGRGTRE